MHFLYHRKRFSVNHQPPSLLNSLWGRPHPQFNPFWPCRYITSIQLPHRNSLLFSWEFTYKGKCSNGVQKHASKWSWIINSSRDVYACKRSLIVVKKIIGFFNIYADFVGIYWVLLQSVIKKNLIFEFKTVKGKISYIWI